MGKTRLEELFYELYASSKQHDPWQRHAMIVELRNLLKQPLSMKMKGNRSDSMVNKIGIPEDQVLDDEELVETEVATELIGFEDGTVKREANAEVISAIVKKEQIPQIQVPISKLEHGLKIHNASLDVCEDFKPLVGVDDLFNHVKARVVLLKKSAGVTINQVAHQLFDQMPSKEKQRKCLKAWKFKFKTTSKRSKLMDDRFSFVEETALLNKDPKETMWDYVKKEFKETMAACGKKRVDRFKLVEEKESRLEVLDLNQTLMYHQIGHGIDTLLICDCSNRSSRANRVWKPGGLLCVQDHSGGSILMRTQRVQGLHLQGIKFQEVIMVNVETGSKEHSHESFGSKGLAYDGCVILGMNFAGFERGEAELLATSQKMQRINLFSFCCSCTNQIFVAIHTEIEGNLEFNQLLAAKEGFSREVIEELSKRIVIEQKIEGGLICGDVKFHLKHKWRFRLFQSISRLVLLALIDLWLSKTHAFSGQLQDLRRGEAENFPLLNFAAEPPFLWMENKSEPVLTASVFERRKKKLCYKTWMFKYKADEEDQGILQLRTGWVQEVSAVIRFRRRGHLHLHLDCEEPELAGRKRNHGLVIRVLNKLKQQRCPKSWMFKFKTDSKSARTNHILLQEKKPNKFEQVMNHTPFSVAKFGKYKDCDALPLFRPSNERFQIKHRELLAIVLEWVDTKGGFGMDKKPLHLSLRNRVWDPGGCLENLEVKVSSRREICYRLYWTWAGSVRGPSSL